MVRKVGEYKYINWHNNKQQAEWNDTTSPSQVKELLTTREIHVCKQYGNERKVQENERFGSLGEINDNRLDHQNIYNT